MKISLKNEDLGSSKAELLIIPVLGKKRGMAFEEANRHTDGALVTVAKKESFKGQAGRSAIWVDAKNKGPKRIIAVGLGTEGANPSSWRRAIGRGMRYAAGHRIKKIGVFIDAAAHEWEQKHVQWVAEALSMAAYRFDKYKSNDEVKIPPNSATISLLPRARLRADLRAALKLGTTGAEAVGFARDLVNEPANLLGPTVLAERAKEMASNCGLTCKIVSEPDLKKMGANLLLAVGAGSNDKPRLVHLTYIPEGAKKKTVALVGKGITFDSGGLCIKPGKSMATMKTDMAGAATVLGIMSALPAFAPEVEVHGIIPIAENSVGANAIRPGDVFTSLSGLTVEIINTDAEGRLVLADAMTYAASCNPDLMVDHATLTGACTVALGLQTAGLFANSKIAVDYLDAAKNAGERFWQLPLADELKPDIKSSIADIKNVGGRFGGAITAALFLERFAKNTPWVHLDIAGPARGDKNTDLCPKGGTGFGVLTALAFLSAM